ASMRVGVRGLWATSGRKALGRAIAPAEIRVGERLRIGAQVGHFVGGRLRWKHLLDQPMGVRAVEGRAVAAAQRIEPAIELALELVDHGRVKSSEARLIEHIVDSVLAFDQEVQPPLAILDIEGEQMANPGGKVLRALSR